jgi:transketolase
MGDQLGEIVEGELVYISESEIRKLLRVSDEHARASLFADAIRLNALYMIARAGSGHIGSSFSSAEIFAWLYLNEVDDATTFFSSKGHDAPGLYAALIATGQLEQDLIHRLRRSQGLPGHPDVAYRGVSANTGSLGMGISKAKGMIRAHRIRGEKHRVFVLTGDGELQEGQIWESLASAANEQVTELTVLIDHNKLQSDTFVSLVSELGDLEAKFSAFGWEVHRIDGHNTREIEQVLAKEPKSPRAIICDTVKGRGAHGSDVGRALVSIPLRSAISR